MPTPLVAAAKTIPDVSVGHALLQMVLALAVIVGCIYGLSKVLARLRTGSMRTRAPRAGRRDATKGLTVISRQPLGKDLSIAAVRWGEREVLVGIAGSTITFLNDAGSEPVRTEDRAATPDESALPSLFAEAARHAAAPVPAAAGASRSSLLDALRDATLRR